MVVSFSSKGPYPVREPTALLNTGAGIIICVSDPARGASSFMHCSRLLTKPALITDKNGTGNTQLTGKPSRVAVAARPGKQNEELKDSIVYVKKTLRSSPRII
ncbi:uncharacterized protein PHALS_15003 [Plasmopara halstedii]|uniref:Uncharacterized protein n=1 Tax=Plasmopara halstedii TaxID=4781 RepID=A0A0N7L7L9_PLAHL|nr:uncharacterized protein PHALS_15003 [Plasmopara halstedii]CEG47443.1 hypothetical protein PHALS_15003 [Plasmopara halstedii]|eukprot:XP_024583812.1 hypothetical protein PHALS_15003 [Plasmopara halstedii]